MTAHPLTGDLTRANEAAGALRALLLALTDDAVPDADRRRITRLCVRLGHELDAAPWRSRRCARDAGALAQVLADVLGA